jgi:hypothetical protein
LPTLEKGKNARLLNFKEGDNSSVSSAGSDDTFRFSVLKRDGILILLAMEIDNTASLLNIKEDDMSRLFIISNQQNVIADKLPNSISKDAHY